MAVETVGAGQAQMVEQPFDNDMLNPAAVDCFIALTHEVYYKTLREYFGDTVVGIFTDEPFERNGDGITVSLPALCGWQCCALVLA